MSTEEQIQAEVQQARALLDEIARKDKERRAAIEHSQRERIKREILAGRYVCCECGPCLESYMRCAKPNRNLCAKTVHFANTDPEVSI